MVVGDRLSNGTYKKENKRMFHNFGNNLVKKAINTIFKSNLNDIDVYKRQTVYKDASIGNMKSFIFMDTLRRMLKYNGYELKHAMNITAVSYTHLNKTWTTRRGK